MSVHIIGTIGPPSRGSESRVADGPVIDSTALVGTAEQVADALLDYYDLGIRNFLIRGFDPFEDVLDYGRALIPLIRQGAAAREAARIAAE